MIDSIAQNWKKGNNFAKPENSDRMSSNNR